MSILQGKFILKSRGNFDNLTGFLEKAKEKIKLGELDKYGREGVEALQAATPKDTGLTSESWSYKIDRLNNDTLIILSFHNSNINKGVPIAVILQYGHGTRNGGWVEGRDYINPALRPVFDRLLSDAWKEVTK